MARLFMICSMAMMILGVTTGVRADQDTDAVKADLSKTLNGLRFGATVDDTRDVKVAGITRGKGGVEKFLQGGQLSVDDMTVTREGEGRKAVYRVVVKAKLSAGYHELHYKGVGGLADKRNEGGLTADVTFQIEDRRGEAKVLDAKVTAQSGFGDGVLIMIESAKNHVINKLKE